MTCILVSLLVCVRVCIHVQTRVCAHVRMLWHIPPDCHTLHIIQHEEVASLHLVCMVEVTWQSTFLPCQIFECFACISHQKNCAK